MTHLLDWKKPKLPPCYKICPKSINERLKRWGYKSPRDSKCWISPIASRRTISFHNTLSKAVIWYDCNSPLFPCSLFPVGVKCVSVYFCYPPHWHRPIEMNDKTEPTKKTGRKRSCLFWNWLEELSRWFRALFDRIFRKWNGADHHPPGVGKRRTDLHPVSVLQ